MIEMSKLFILILIVGSCLLPFQGYSQQEKLDSLLSRVNTASDTAKINTYNKICAVYLDKDTTQVLRYARKALTLARQSHYPQGKITAILYIGRYYRKLGKWDEAQKEYKEALALSKNHDFTLGETEAYIGLGELYLDQSKYKEALRYFRLGLKTSQRTAKKELSYNSYTFIGNVYYRLANYPAALQANLAALKLAHSLKNKNLIANSSVNVGNVYTATDELEKAISYYNQAIKFRAAKKTDSLPVAELINIGACYLGLNKPDLALRYLLKAYNYTLQNNKTYHIAFVSLYVGKAYYDKKDYNKALEHFTKAVSSAKASSNKMVLTSAYNWLGNTYRELHDYNKAISYSSKSLELAQENQFSHGLQDVFLSLSQSYSALGDYKEAFEYQSRHIALRDSLFSQENSRKIANLQHQHELDRKQAQIELLSKDKLLQRTELRKQRLLQVTLVGGLLLFSAFSALLFYAYRQKNTAHAQLQRQHARLVSQSLQIDSQRGQLEQKNERLQQLNEEKQFLVGMVAHDLKGPLASLGQLVGILEQELSQQVISPDHSRLIGMMGKTTARLTQTVHTILDVQAAEQGQVDAQQQAVHLAPVLREAVQDLEATAEVKQIRLLTDLRQEDMSVLANRLHLRSVFDNLISNAIKYSPPGGSVYIGQRLTEGERLRVEVRDQGPGISASDQRQLFSPFRRLEARPTAGESSSGLGLSIVKRLVDQMDACVWCESEPGQGTTFIVEFAVHRQETGVPEGASLAQQSVG